jgi:ribosomal-protein-alanine N-acetyltransferase
MSLDDLDQVCALEDLSFNNPWGPSSFEYEIRNKDAIMKVAEVNNSVVGFICVRFLLDVTHILDIVTMPRHRRMGIGSMLLFDALQEIKRTRPETGHITLEVRESNTSAIKLYEKSGFRKTGRRKYYYSNPVEDGIIMGMDIDEGLQA